MHKSIKFQNARNDYICKYLTNFRIVYGSVPYGTGTHMSAVLSRDQEIILD